MSMRLSLAALTGLGFAGCADQALPPAPIDLRLAMGEADPSPVGIAVDPDGVRYLFDQDRGLYRFDGADLHLVMPVGGMPDPGVAVRPPFTDIVAVGPGQLAITALGDGYLLDVARATMRQWFCYVPTDLPPDYDQRTDAVAYDADAGLLFAQPRTFSTDGNLIASQISSYSYQTGTDLDWQSLPIDISAGAMVKLPGFAEPVLAVGSALCTFPARPDEPEPQPTDVVDLAGIGVGHIDGLALDAAARTLLVLDGEHDQLFELGLDDLHR